MKTSPNKNLAIQWRALQNYLNEFGNVPIGQQFLLTTLFLAHNNGWNPTVQELSKITGLPRSTASRYVAVLIKQGVIVETINSHDRRKRHLHPTAKGNRARKKIIKSYLEIVTRLIKLDVPEADSSGSKLHSVDDLFDTVDEAKRK